MKGILVAVLLAVVAIAGFMAFNKVEPPKPEPVAMESLEQKASYLLGHGVGKNLKTDVGMIDEKAFIKGIGDALNDKDSVLPEEEAQKVFMEFQQMVMAKKQEEAKVAAAKNLAEAEKFLAENKDKEGVKTTVSGLEYQVLTEGDGPSPTVEDIVTCHYVGTLLDGTEFDSSVKRGQPATFPLNGVIPGWREALPMMKVGSKWKLWVPPALAYGEQGAPPVIGPNQLLVFEVELIKIEQLPKPEATPEAGAADAEAASGAESGEEASSE